MIKLEIDTANYDLDDDLRNRIVDRIGGLDEFMNSLDEGHVKIAWEGGPGEKTKMSAEVWGAGHRFEASDTDWKAVKAIDQTRQKLESQITGAHSKETDDRDHGR